MGMSDPIDGLSDDEITLLGEAAARIAPGARAKLECSDAAEAQGKRSPSLRAYGIAEIKRLARRLGTPATHWLEE